MHSGPKYPDTPNTPPHLRERAAMPEGSLARRGVSESTWSRFSHMSVLLQPKPLLEGCTTAYLDMGTNAGHNINSLYEPTRYKYQGYLGRWLRNHTEPRDRLCILGFEPNPVHAPVLRNLTRKHRQAGRRLHVFAAAISDTNGVTSFWSDNDPWHSNWGSSLLPRVNGTRFVVPTVALDWLLREHVLSVAGLRTVLAKLDIEGAEFAALPPAMDSGLLCRTIDHLALEWHPAKLYTSRRHSEESLSKFAGWHAKASAAKLGDGLQLLRQQFANRTCRTQFQWLH